MAQQGAEVMAKFNRAHEIAMSAPSTLTMASAKAIREAQEAEWQRQRKERHGIPLGAWKAAINHSAMKTYYDVWAQYPDKGVVFMLRIVHPGPKSLWCPVCSSEMSHHSIIGHNMQPIREAMIEADTDKLYTIMSYLYTQRKRIQRAGKMKAMRERIGEGR